MIRVLSLVAALTVLPLSAALAQDAERAAPHRSAHSDEAQSPEQAAFEARAEAFGEGVSTMAGEMQAAIATAGSDTARKTADLDAIQARYQASADSFANDLQAFVASEATKAPAEEAAEMIDGLGAAVAQIREVPALVRAQIEQAAAAAPAAQ